jgi:hypothetical protein
MEKSQSACILREQANHNPLRCPTPLYKLPTALGKTEDAINNRPITSLYGVHCNNASL